MKHVKLKAGKAGSVRITQLKEANLHRFADAGVPGENDAIALPNFLKKPLIERTNEQHVRVELDTGEDALSGSGAIRVQHGILADAYSLH